MVDRAQLKAEILQAVLSTMRSAQVDGRDPMQTAEAAYPGIPDSVLFDAYFALEREREESWWQSVECTIDGEVLHRAITQAVPNVG